MKDPGPNSGVRHPGPPFPQCEEPQTNPRVNPACKWPLSVIMICGSEAMRVSMRALVRHEPGLFMIAEAQTGTTALALVFRWQPAVALVEVCLPDRNGFEVVRCINQLVPSCATVILSNTPDPCVEDVARIVGAKSVWHMASGVDQLRRTFRGLVHEVLTGTCPI